jgi:hypothetical protein
MVSVHKKTCSSIPTVQWQVQDLTSSSVEAISAGDLVKIAAAGSPYVIPLVDGDLTIGTDTALVGVAASDSTATATADGVVDIYLPLPGIVWKMPVTTATNFDTEAEILALQGDRVTIDATGTTYTLDENDGDGANNAFYIVGGNPETGEAYFTIRSGATYLSI